MLEKLGFEELVHETVNLELRRQTRSMAPYQFLIGMILAVYVGFSRLNHLQYLEREPMLLGILRVSRLPVQSTFWRFLESLHLTVAAQLVRLEARLRNGDKPSGEDIARHLRLVIEHLPKTVKKTRTRIVNANSPIDRKAGTRLAASGSL